MSTSTLGELLRTRFNDVDAEEASNAVSRRHPNREVKEFHTSTDYLYDADLAAGYIATRMDDATSLMSEVKWSNNTVAGAVRWEVCGHSILWDLTGQVLHCSYNTQYEILPYGVDDIVLVDDFRCIIAFILARNW